jgi:hypothetical protein
MKKITRLFLLIFALIAFVKQGSVLAQTCAYDFTYMISGTTVAIDNTQDMTTSGGSVIWSSNGTNFATGNDPVYVAPGPGTYNICMLVYDPSCGTTPTYYVCHSITLCSASVTANNVADSVMNVAYPGSSGSYAISNPLMHDGTQYTNAPTTTSCIVTCKTDYVYFFDFDLAVPAGATITGVEVQHGRGACNSGAWMIDTLHLAYNGAVIGSVKRDSSSTFERDTLGSSMDTWGAALTPAMVNSGKFGVMINGTGNGICTFVQSDVRLNIYYCVATGIMQAEAVPEIIVYPNPAGDKLQLTIKDQLPGGKYVITDIAGKVAAGGEISGLQTEIILSGLENGMYLLRVSGNKGDKTIKFVKQ